MKVPIVVKEWSSIPKRIRKSVGDLRDADLLIRGGSEGWSIAEYVHHLVEANLIASHVVLAALGKPGCTYDWSWVTPNKDWMTRLGYDRAPIEPAVKLLESLNRHISSLVKLNPRSVRQPIAILDTPGGFSPSKHRGQGARHGGHACFASSRGHRIGEEGDSPLAPFGQEPEAVAWGIDPGLDLILESGSYESVWN
jgi:hypothetical protein